MGSLGSGEILVIAVAALIVFGPKRLPEIARKASEILTKTREATQSVTKALDSEFDGVAAPLQTLKSEYDATMRSIKGAAMSVGDTAVSPSTSAKPSNADGEDGSADGDGGAREADATPDIGDMAVAIPLDDELPGEAGPDTDPGTSSHDGATGSDGGASEGVEATGGESTPS